MSEKITMEIIKNNIINNLFNDSEKINESINKNILQELEISFDDSSSLIIKFSTRHYPVPVRISFIQKRIKEILETIIHDNLILNDILIAIEECVTNIIEHSYQKSDYPLIIFEFCITNSSISIEIRDFGKRGNIFDFNSKGNYNSQDDIMESVKKSGRGLGVFLMKKVMDHVEYKIVKDEYNKITMKKNIHKNNLLNELQPSVDILKSQGTSLNYDFQLVKQTDDYIIFKIYGMLTLQTSQNLITELEKMENKLKHNNLVFDLENLDSMSSSGLEVFMYLLKLTQANNKKIIFSGMNYNIKRIFEITGFYIYFYFCDNINGISNYI